MSTRGTLLFASSYPASFFFLKFSIICFAGLLFSWRCSAIFQLLEQLDTVVARAQFNAIDSYKAYTAAANKHSCRHSSLLIERRPQLTVRLSDLFVNLDSCVEDGFFFFFGVRIRGIWPIFSLPQLTFDLTSTPSLPGSSQYRSSISLTTAPRNHVEHSFRKARQL